MDEEEYVKSLNIIEFWLMFMVIPYCVYFLFMNLKVYNTLTFVGYTLFFSFITYLFFEVIFHKITGKYFYPVEDTYMEKKMSDDKKSNLLRYLQKNKDNLSKEDLEKEIKKLNKDELEEMINDKNEDFDSFFGTKELPDIDKIIRTEKKIDKIDKKILEERKLNQKKLMKFKKILQKE